MSITPSISKLNTLNWNYLLFKKVFGLTLQVKNISLSDLSRNLGISYADIVNIRDLIHYDKIDNVDKFCEWMGVKVTDFIINQSELVKHVYCLVDLNNFDYLSLYHEVKDKLYSRKLNCKDVGLQDIDLLLLDNNKPISYSKLANLCLILNIDPTKFVLKEKTMQDLHNLHTGDVLPVKQTLGKRLYEIVKENKFKKINDYLNTNIEPLMISLAEKGSTSLTVGSEEINSLIEPGTQEVINNWCLKNGLTVKFYCGDQRDPASATFSWETLIV